MTTSPPASEAAQKEWLESERQWVAKFQFLKDSGYLLRPRYRPDWVPPWTLKQGASRLSYESGIEPSRPELLDAQRLSDGRTVMLKIAPKDSPEIPIGQYLSSTELQQDPRNHSLPLLEVLHDPSDAHKVILVLPLVRRVDEPPPASIRECCDLIEQTLEGLVFLHEHKVAHRDCAWGNIMMDGRALFPKSWHPQLRATFPDGREMKNPDPSRTAVGGVRYYFIDFGISSRDQDKVLGIDGQEPAPELSATVPYDPYKLDVYVLGMAYRHLLLEEHVGAEVFLPLINFMSKPNPADRPTAAESLQRYQELSKTFSSSILSQRLRPKAFPESTLVRMIRDLHYRVQDFYWSRQKKAPLSTLA
ncbi:hypothetical protein FRC01_009033 [Tulasnella sp. 417]|nr:hypothetical protein FRC01_009033 [Tulasnella sp. 417]